MLNWPWRSLVLTATATIILTAFLVPDPSAQGLSSLSTTELIRLLASPREVVRQAASGQLIARAKTVVPDLIRAAQVATGEQLRELVAILEELMLASDQQVSESAELALEDLGDSDDHITRDLARKVLQRNSTLRHTRSVARVEELGGMVLIASGNESTLIDLQDDPDLIASISAMGRPRPTTRIVVLDHNWQGGDAGLRHVSRLFPGEMLSLHLTDDAPVTAVALQLLRAQRSNTVLRRPNQGCLGVVYHHEENTNELAIAAVMPRSPAEQAGLRGGDVVMTLNGKSIKRFRELADWARDHPPTDMIEMTVRRRGAAVRVRFALGSDFGTGNCRCVEE